MPEHPADCECCRVQVSRTDNSKRKRQDADLATFLPEAREEELGEEEEEGQPEWAEEEEAEEEADAHALIHETLFKSFEAHVERLDAARRRRIETLSFKSALEDDGKDDVNQDATQDEIDGLGVWLPGDEFQGDVNYRTLQKLLTRVDQRGFERCVHANNASTNPTQCCTNYALALPQPRSAQQLEFHVAFMKAAARVIYRGSWETERPAIMKRYGWETSNSEVLIRHTRAHKLGAVYTVRLTRALLCAQYPAPLRQDVFVRPTRDHASAQRAQRTSAHALTAPVCLAASPSSARALRSRSASRSVRHGDIRVGVPAACTDASMPSAQSSSRPRVVPAASCLSGLWSKQRPLERRGAQPRRSPARGVRASQVCATGWRRAAHLRVQPGGVPPDRL